MQQLKQVIKRYTPGEQKEIMYYMQSNGSTIDYDLIERLQRDLYKLRQKVSKSMSYDREAIKQFIRDYSKENHDTTFNDENTNIDDFFTLNEDVESMNIVDVDRK